ncbi:MAG: glycosyltransferase family protein [Deltaproteobacteria bacterium]|nr:glycosyltransferase family protein [Deltaproteobacteria bacterium]MBW2388662.1 glycosyltransferase family protein [Deltaproteobacteria bacterium]
MIVGVLQARMSSRRLPGKVLMPLHGRPMLARQIERLQRCPSMRLMVATSDHPGDDPIVSLCRELDVVCHRGSLDDVLDRVHGAACRLAAEHVVRLTGDCPLTDPELVEIAIDHHLKSGCDYTSNALERTYPDGLDVEVIRFAALEVAWREAVLPSHREHVTPFIYQQPERFKLGSLTDSCDRSALRWVVDEPADLEFVNRVYAALYPDDPQFGSDAIHALLSREPALSELNRGIDPEAGWRRSQAEDRRQLAHSDATDERSGGQR